jgi:hypothetical protein
MDGTLSLAAIATYSFSQLNFTECTMITSYPYFGYGFVLLCEKPTAEWSLAYTTVLKCAGTAGLYAKQSNLPTVSFCNFYDNAMRDDGALLYCSQSGMIVSSCIFSGTLNAPELFQPDTDPANFQVSDCVFSGPIPGGAIYASTTRNIANAATASFVITYFHTEHCPTAYSTPLPVFDPTAIFTARGGIAYHRIRHFISAGLFFAAVFLHSQ